jgi:hypothetical protein
MRSTIAIALLLGCSTSPALATPTSVRVWESPHEGSITEGETTLEIEPDAAYAATIDYPRWSSMFPDIEHMEVKNQHGADARVTLIHHDGSRDNVHFHNQPQARMVWFEDTGGRAEVWAEIMFLPGERAGTTRVHSRLFADVHGVASLVVSDGRLRSLRRQRMTGDLSHLHAYFSAAQVASHRTTMVLLAGSLTPLPAGSIGRRLRDDGTPRLARPASTR